MEELELSIKKIVPVLGPISAGKSTFLNYLMGCNILQTGGSLTTRFILIIRHNPNQEEPKLFHICRKVIKYTIC